METNAVTLSMGAPVQTRETSESPPAYPPIIPNAATIAAMQEEDDSPSYTTVDELFTALRAENAGT